MYEDLEQSVMLHLNKCEKAYTKPMHRQFKTKEQYRLSLNKFRDLLYKIHQEGKIKFNQETDSNLPYWNSKNEKHEN